MTSDSMNRFEQDHLKRWWEATCYYLFADMESLPGAAAEAKDGWLPPQTDSRDDQVIQHPHVHQRQRHFQRLRQRLVGLRWLGDNLTHEAGHQGIAQFDGLRLGLHRVYSGLGEFDFDHADSQEE